MGPEVKKLKTKGLRDGNKHAREQAVLLGLVDLYIRTGQPVGSNTLKESVFQHLSSATLRNYFVHLEEEGYLTQQHSSGGRIPTAAAFRLYALENRDYRDVSGKDGSTLAPLAERTTHGITAYLEESAVSLSSLTQTAVFLSAPRFDHDFIIHLKLVGLDTQRILCVLVTNFGVIKTEVLHTDTPLSSFSLKRIENYFHWRLTGHDKPLELTAVEETYAHDFYNEVMVRYIVGYSNFSDEEIFRTGFSRLLNYSEFADVAGLASGLALFENPHVMRRLLRECSAADSLKFWIGDDLSALSAPSGACSVIAYPYSIGHKVVGAVALLGPMRMPYRRYFGALSRFCENIGEALTKSIYKFNISYREPQSHTATIAQRERILLEDKSQ